MPRAGTLVIEARTADGAQATARLTIETWSAGTAASRARNIILLLGDGMGAAHRTAARIVSRGIRSGRAAGRLAMDLEVTGMVMTASLNATMSSTAAGIRSTRIRRASCCSAGRRPRIITKTGWPTGRSSRLLCRRNPRR